MDVGLTADQELFVSTSQRFIENTYPLSSVRSVLEGGAEPSPGYRMRVAELGWFSMLVPEDLGGGSVSGNGVMDAALIAYVRGAALQPHAFVSGNVVAFAVAVAGTDEQRSDILPGVVAGETSVSWALLGGRQGAAPGSGAVAREGDGVYVLSGSTTLVQDAVDADWLLVSAVTNSGPAQFLVSSSTPGVRAEPRESLDLTRRFCDVAFDDVELPLSTLVGAPGDRALFDRLVHIAAVLQAAETVGAMDADFELTADYARNRIAFGRPIGSFQAVKHGMADASLMLEMSKALVMAAAQAVGEERRDAAALAGAAKAFVGDAGIDLTQACFQVFGGVGFTWEHDQHLYLRRVATDVVLCGDPVWHRERICQLAGL
jgi:alkylation response protein AidB-like acyl-CoA dehydrogenase